MNNNELDKLNETLKEYANYAIKLVNENKIKDKEIERLKKDLINLLRIIDKNCDDLEGTEEEFDSLDRAENLLQELKEGVNDESNRNV